MNETFMPERIYCKKTQLGNWFEDLRLDDSITAVFLKKKAKNELLTQKSRTLYGNLFKDVILDPLSETIRYGAIVQIVPCKMNVCEQYQGKIDPALSINLSERFLEKCQKVSSLCELTVAPSPKSCVRNSFIIQSCDNRDLSKRELLKYGEEFMIKCTTPKEEEELYLYSAQKAASGGVMIPQSYFTKHCGEINLPVGLCSKKEFGPGTAMPTAYVKWKCLHEDPNLRFEYEGLPIPSDKPLVIRHIPTNHNLAIETFEIGTLWGQECLVSAHTYVDVHKRDTWQNIWKFKIG